MNAHDRYDTQSIWSQLHMPHFHSLTDSIDVDVCIVGGGIAGLTTAYLLMEQGKQVCVLEAAQIGSGQTSRTTAQFSTNPDLGYAKLTQIHGREAARIVAESRRAAIQKVESIIQEESLDCDFEKLNGFLFSPAGDEREDFSENLRAAWDAGLLDVEALRGLPIKSLHAGQVLRFSEQAQFHPLKYMAGLAQKIEAGGGLIFTGTSAVEFHPGHPCSVFTSQGERVMCSSIVVATNSPVNDVFAIHTKQAPYRSYVLGLQIPKGSVPRALYWDTLEPYHYVRLDMTDSEAFDVLLVGGEDHKTGQEDYPEERFDALEKWARENFPMIEGVLYEWSGQVMEPVDGIPYLGHNPGDRKDVYVITGDAGDGMVHGLIGAMIITDQIMGRKNNWEALYSPSRITLKTARDFIKENANVAVQYGDWLAIKSKPDFADLANNEGAVFRDGLKMIAGYKNEWGQVELMSAACPHLAGVVAWNSVEKSWDCPCHGSRFDCRGKVIEGPAFSDLVRMEEISGKLQEVLEPRDDAEFRLRQLELGAHQPFST